MDNFDFLNDKNKIEKLKNVNIALKIDNMEEKFKHNNIVFVYSMPKVGSTSLVSSLRLFAFYSYVIIHIHDEIMLEVLAKVKDVNITEIINYNGFLKRNIFVIDIYRSPIEHKISAFFEKIDTFHFNTNVENINKYSIDKLITRFNKIFPYLSNGDHFMDKYEIDKYASFDYEKKYLIYNKNNIKYLKLRLDDVDEWKNIIYKFLNVDIVIVNDNTATNKEIKVAYKNFKDNYKIPKNFLEDITNNRYFNFYYSSKERDDYISKWSKKTTNYFTPISENEYKLYIEITLENQVVNKIEKRHYIYDGCICKACLIKRGEIIQKLKNGEKVDTKIIHEEANKELKNNKNKSLLIAFNKLNNERNKRINKIILTNTNTLIPQKKIPKSILAQNMREVSIRK